jgi:hypothetical protein
LFALERGEFALDLLAPRRDLGERIVDAFRFDLGFGGDGLPISGFFLELDLAGNRRARQILTAFAQRIAGVIRQLGQLGADFFLGIGAAAALAVRRLAIVAKALLGLFELARGLAHQHDTAGPLGQFERAVGAGANDPLDADEN